MSTMGASAAGLGRFPNILNSYSAAGVNESSRGSPSDSSRAEASRQSPAQPTPNGTSVTSSNAHGPRPTPGVSEGDHSTSQDENAHRAAYDAKQSYEDQAEKIAELVERFEETAAQISRFVKAADITDPPGPNEIQRRLVDHLMPDVADALAVGGTASVQPKSKLAEGMVRPQSPGRRSLNVVL